MKLCHSVWLLCLPVLCAFGQTTIYVATTGSDTDGNGSAGNPYLTISNGVDKAVAGDTVLVNPGVYTQMVNIYITKDITVRGMHAPTGAVITTMYPDVNYSTRCVRVSSAGAVFDGFTLEKGYPPNNYVNQYGFGLSPFFILNQTRLIPFGVRQCFGRGHSRRRAIFRNGATRRQCRQR